VPEAAERFDAGGTLRDPEVEAQLSELLVDLADAVEAREAALARAAA
jgi:hypothetical protein